MYGPNDVEKSSLDASLLLACILSLQWMMRSRRFPPGTTWIAIYRGWRTTIEQVAGAAIPTTRRGAGRHGLFHLDLNLSPAFPYASIATYPVHNSRVPIYSTNCRRFWPRAESFHDVKEDEISIRSASLRVMYRPKDIEHSEQPSCKRPRQGSQGPPEPQR